MTAPQAIHKRVMAVHAILRIDLVCSIDESEHMHVDELVTSGVQLLLSNMAAARITEEYMQTAFLACINTPHTSILLMRRWCCKTLQACIKV